ncbi:nucleotidyltransferase [bacterium]|nr:nucleotidyltransferase [bacterium]
MKHNIDFGKITIEELAKLIGEHLSKYGIEAVLVGGACVSIYSKNKYMSYDLDFISYESDKKIKEALEEIGFKYDRKKYYTHPDCKYFLEFLVPPIVIGNQPIQKFNRISSELGSVKILTPTDCVKDRLAAYIYWDDKESLEQAVMVARSQKINMNEIKKWAEKEIHGKKVEDFIERIKREKKNE